VNVIVAFFELAISGKRRSTASSCL